MPEDEGIALEPFNLEQERREGFFDEEGHYVEKKDDEEKDAWLASGEGAVQRTSQCCACVCTSSRAPHLPYGGCCFASQYEGAGAGCVTQQNWLGKLCRRAGLERTLSHCAAEVVSERVRRQIAQRQRAMEAAEAAPEMSGRAAAELKRTLAELLLPRETVTAALRRLRPAPSRPVGKRGVAAQPCWQCSSRNCCAAMSGSLCVGWLPGYMPYVCCDMVNLARAIPCTTVLHGRHGFGCDTLFSQPPSLESLYPAHVLAKSVWQNIHFSLLECHSWLSNKMVTASVLPQASRNSPARPRRQRRRRQTWVQQRLSSASQRRRARSWTAASWTCTASAGLLPAGVCMIGRCALACAMLRGVSF